MSVLLKPGAFVVVATLSLVLVPILISVPDADGVTYSSPLVSVPVAYQNTHPSDKDEFVDSANADTKLVGGSLRGGEFVRGGEVDGSLRGGEVLVFSIPVDAQVSDPFRKPEGPYGPGNRGIEYFTKPGDVVRATAAGEVSFAGQVAGELYVTVDHGGGVLSTYSYLSRISVFEGERLTQGEIVGLAGERLLHFSVRVNGEYVDPMKFIGVRKVTVMLIPN